MSSDSTPPKEPRHWRIAAALGLSVGAGTLVLIPYLLQVDPNMREALQSMSLPTLVTLQCTPRIIAITGVSWIGLKVGHSAQLDAPHLRALIEGDVASKPADWQRALLVGVGTGVASLSVEWLFNQFVPALPFFAPGLVIGSIISVEGGIADEAILRLFAMPLVVAGLLRFTSVRRNVAIGTGIAVSTALVVLREVGSVTSVVEGTFGIVARTATLNVIASVPFGMLMAEHGIEHAMAAHICTNAVTYAIAPFVSGLLFGA